MDNNKKIILTDADGVLLQWGKMFSIFMKEKGYVEIPNMEHEYQLWKRYENVTAKEVYALVEEMNTSEYVSRLEPLPGAVENVRKLAKLGYKFIVITAISETPQAAIYRAQNLDNVFGTDIFSHEEMVCVKTGSSKDSALKQYAGSGLFWIEDHFKHAEAGYENGLKSILISDPHNLHFHTDLFPRVNTWDEIFKIITDDVNYEDS